jgi:hypothetical protein
MYWFSEGACPCSPVATACFTVSPHCLACYRPWFFRETLANSLNSEQREAMSEILERYRTALNELVASTDAPAAGTNKVFLPHIIGSGDSGAAATTTPQFDLNVFAEISAIKASIDQEMAAVLSVEQYASYAKLTALPEGTPNAIPSATTAANTSLCFQSAAWASFAYYAAGYSRSFAFVLTLLYTGTTADDNIAFTLQKAETYQRTSLSNLSGAYFGLYVFGRDFGQFTIFGRDDQRSATENSVSGYNDAVAFYAATGFSDIFAYYTQEFAYYQKEGAIRAFDLSPNCD